MCSYLPSPRLQHNLSRLRWLQVWVLVSSNYIQCRLQVLSATILYLEQEHVCMRAVPMPLWWWQGTELRHSCDTPKINRYRPESWSVFEAQISDDRADRSLEAPLKYSRRHHQFRDGRRKARNEHVNTLKSVHGVRISPIRVQDSLREFNTSNVVCCTLCCSQSYS
jgi:hypothetical protein